MNGEEGRQLSRSPLGDIDAEEQAKQPMQHACNESHNSHYRHAGRKPYCLSRSQQQLACSHIKKNLDFNRKWGCHNKHKFLSLVFMITKPPRSRDWRYHSTQSRCKDVRWKDPFRVCCSRRLWVKQVMLSAHTAGLWWLPFAVKSRKRCLQLAGLLSYNEVRLMCFLAHAPWWLSGPQQSPFGPHARRSTATWCSQPWDMPGMDVLGKQWLGRDTQITLPAPAQGVSLPRWAHAERPKRGNTVGTREMGPNTAAEHPQFCSSCCFLGYFGVGRVRFRTWRTGWDLIHLVKENWPRVWLECDGTAVMMANSP